VLHTAGIVSATGIRPYARSVRTHTGLRRRGASGHCRSVKSSRFTALSGITVMLPESGWNPT
jgi:hypothetical protein